MTSDLIIARLETSASGLNITIQRKILNRKQSMQEIGSLSCYFFLLFFF